MDRRTVIAIVLSVIVITIGFTIQSILFPPAEVTAPTENGAQDPAGTTTTIDGQPTTTTGTDGSTDTGQTTTTTVAAPSGSVAPVPESGISIQERTYQNELVAVTMSPVGGTIVSYRLKDHRENDQPVEMILRGTEEQRAFELRFGTYQTKTIDALFHYQEASTTGNVFEFYRDFYVVGMEDQPFRITKRYTFMPGEYMFKLDVEITNSVNAVIPLNFGGNAYTLSYGPQIGPSFQQLDMRTEFRRYFTYSDGKKNTARVSAGRPEQNTDSPRWAAIAGKYFVLAGIPGLSRYETVLAQEPREGLPEGSQLHFTRPAIQASVQSDSYFFFLGPKTPAELDRYDNAEDNGWNLSGQELGQAVETRFLFGWLETILKTILQLIARVVPNYGVAIIILTVLVKLALWPLTRKSYESNARMQALNPKTQELRERYKDNPTKMNQEMAALYKKEGVSPLGGCLPMLLQFPFFIAMYGLFNNHFDLRGATFIPGWITDLSAPDSIINFGVTIPLINWTDLRGLPIIFLGTQLISSRLTQNPSSASSAGQMKLMMTALPIVFFFILYNVPSGLLVYWIFSNVLTSGQQYYYMRVKKNTPPPGPSKKKK